MVQGSQVEVNVLKVKKSRAVGEGEKQVSRVCWVRQKVAEGEDKEEEEGQVW